MEKTLARQRQPRWWHFWKRCTRLIRGPPAMLLKRWRSMPVTSRHGKPSHAPAPCPHVVAAGFDRGDVHIIGDSVSLSARLDCPAKCLPYPHPRLAACCLYERSCLSVDCRRISTRRTRSPVTHVSHDEASSVDDGCCSADFGGEADISAGVRTAEALHQEPSCGGRSAGA